MRGDLMYSFTHSSPVTCVCPGFKPRINYVFACYRDGSIRVWILLTDAAAKTSVNLTPVYKAPGSFVCSMRYAHDGPAARIFSAGVGAAPSEETTLVEWNETEGTKLTQFGGFANSDAASLAQLSVAGGRYLCLTDANALKVRTPHGPPSQRKRAESP